MNALQSYLKSFHLLTQEEIDFAHSITTSREIKKGDFFIQEGRICREVAFIVSGGFRSFYHSSKSEEITYCFRFSPSFMTAYSSFITGLPTEENFQALVDSELHIISKTALQELESSGVNWLKLSKYLAEQEYLEMERRVFLLQKESAEKKYHDLMSNHPHFLQLIPLNYLASYLGITQRHLSRIRSSYAN
ncbi:MAG: cyclic nucleotide-binding domain-containing protein [Bacteroidota bacterium]